MAVVLALVAGAGGAGGGLCFSVAKINRALKNSGTVLPRKYMGLCF